ncbi:hypothetical protein [Niveispirillum sp. KHB5.9]|uniref:hypothetical protein n=1 Tax=Niveispirillum sp. KHB5.9 TaxID=3400269 RepID=UPI003A860C01
MTDAPTNELRQLAAKIVTSYAQANPVGPEQLTGVIRLAYQGLQRCITPVPVAAPAVQRKKRRRGRPSAS